VLLVTNRVGQDARLMPGRAFPRDDFKQLLHEFPLEDVKVRPWQVDYDLAWAVKTGEPRGGGVRPLPQVLRCPVCRGQLSREVQSFVCADCGRGYPVADDGVIEMARIDQT